MKSYKILYCEGNTDGTIGGSYYSLFYLAEGLERTRFQPIVVFHRDHRLISKFRNAGITTYVLERPRPVHFGVLRKGICVRHPWVCRPIELVQSAANFTKNFLLTSVRYAHFLRKHRIDLVHLNNSITRNHDWMMAAKLAGIPCVTHERGINRNYSFSSRLMARGLDAVICISQAVRESLVSHGVNTKRMRVVYNGLDYQRVQTRRNAREIREKYGIADSQPVVGIVGNLKEWKGQETVVRAVSLVKAKYPTIVCLLVGDTAEDDRYYEERIRRVVTDNAMERNIVFTGYQENVADFTNVMDIVIHASELPEPFGRVLLEAMAMKKPLIGARAGAVTEIIDEGVTGSTFTPGNWSELASRITELLEDGSRAQRLGECGFRRLVEHFNISRNIETTTNVYKEVLQNER